VGVHQYESPRDTYADDVHTVTVGAAVGLLLSIVLAVAAGVRVYKAVRARPKPPGHAFEVLPTNAAPPRPAIPLAEVRWAPPRSARHGSQAERR
jgi:hypothetical protein